MGNCVRSNIESRPSRPSRSVQTQYQYQPTEQVDTGTTIAAPNKQPENPDEQQQHEQDQPSPWQQQEVLVQHIADREGAYVIFVCIRVQVCVQYTINWSVSLT